MKPTILAASLGATFLLGAAAAAEVDLETQNRPLSRSEAVRCVALAASVQGQNEVVERWRRAMNNASTSSNSATTVWNSINNRLNSAIDALNADDRRYASSCGRTTLPRSVYDEVCADLSGNGFCDSFSWN